MPRPGLTTLQLVTPIRDELVQAGYEILYECMDRDCGGFDFRYQLSLLPEPFMHVDLGDFRYLTARPEAGTGPELISVTVSRSAEAGFVHVTRIAEARASDDLALVGPPANRRLPEQTAEQSAEEVLSVALETEGRAILDGLRFAPGSAELEDAEFEALETLATWLLERPEARVVLVGHSDAVGALAANIALSRARARSIADRLVEAHGVLSDQLEAEGAGFLAPRALNATEEGRALNRRVEVVVLETG
ncbi:MAG: OmpA family protein [Pseudomonadota bacterium]